MLLTSDVSPSGSRSRDEGCCTVHGAGSWVFHCNIIRGLRVDSVKAGPHWVVEVVVQAIRFNGF